MPVYSVAYLTWNYQVYGRYPQVLQGNKFLFRSGNYGVQLANNANPDNHWDGRHRCWTSDPYCGLDIGPKRPWEDLKEPSKVLHKFERDMTVNAVKVKSGIRGT